jgi:hypothetical protein
MDNPKRVADLVIREIRAATGRRYPELERALEGMEVKVLWDAYRLMQDIGQEMRIARKRPMWPGGPRI